MTALPYSDGKENTIARYNEQRQPDSAALHPDERQNVRTFEIDEEFPLEQPADAADTTDEDTLIDDE
jgi:hypothetical protein